ncbi:hypothetical protein cce_4527 [Crocosphaera subtropica ATCC 51142]|uniref:Uncharacterized protein n=1 Tax=Crocosphaera subtropica (strain ATCC 51142 / BH68) TaxID=43989 RepID=B1WUM1_CROS5|nr:hypothetical protein [Crocosphaera subtropica]ACB53875.1 hypothetical protein cce_4527 [Crocosphaera subtropica ATCC 51142]
MILLYLLAWFPMIVIAILNATVREKIYGKFVTELQAHQLSTLTAVLLFAAYIWGLTSLFPLKSSSQAIVIGCLWLVLTVMFEFSFGHYVAQQSWAKLLQDYNLLAGRVWIFVPLCIAIFPWLFYQLH